MGFVQNPHIFNRCVVFWFVILTGRARAKREVDHLVKAGDL